jgi:hypothetical protein
MIEIGAFSLSPPFLFFLKKNLWVAFDSDVSRHDYCVGRAFSANRAPLAILLIVVSTICRAAPAGGSRTVV